MLYKFYNVQQQRLLGILRTNIGQDFVEAPGKPQRWVLTRLGIRGWVVKHY